MAYNSEYTGRQIDDLLRVVSERQESWSGKQPKLTGRQGQVVGFDVLGNAVPQDFSGGGGGSGEPGPEGPEGPPGPAGPGVAAGGAPGQVLAKKSAKDYDTKWIDPPESGGGVMPTAYKVTLAADTWQDRRQSVYIEGISDDESAQLIQPVVASASFSVYAEAQVQVSQSLNQLIFTCENVPAADIVMYVVIQPVQPGEQEAVL